MGDTQLIKVFIPTIPTTKEKKTIERVKERKKERRGRCLMVGST